jgi:hypothetical protein
VITSLYGFGPVLGGVTGGTVVEGTAPAGTGGVFLSCATALANEIIVIKKQNSNDRKRLRWGIEIFLLRNEDK